MLSCGAGSMLSHRFFCNFEICYLIVFVTRNATSYFDLLYAITRLHAIVYYRTRPVRSCTRPVRSCTRPRRLSRDRLALRRAYSALRLPPTEGGLYCIQPKAASNRLRLKCGDESLLRFLEAFARSHVSDISRACLIHVAGIPR